MVTRDRQEKVLSSHKVLLWIFLKTRYLVWRYAELNRLLVGSGLIPLNIKLQQDDRTICCGRTDVYKLRPMWTLIHKMWIIWCFFLTLPLLVKWYGLITYFTVSCLNAFFYLFLNNLYFILYFFFTLKAFF